MDITQFINENSIFIDFKSKSKKNILENISHEMSNGNTKEKDLIFEKLYEREKLGTTAFGNGIAIPHARIPDLKEPKVIIIKLLDAIHFEAIDGEKVDLIISLIVPDKKNDLHVKLLAKIAELLENKTFRLKIREAANVKDILSVVKNFKQ
ncbi:MAG: PTS fructose transporter subunit IIA [Gammaproteobacteria bacterium]|nr:PTS fructose transporter subunit IIA [Gammaproteobacteria bacterium]